MNRTFTNVKTVSTVNNLANENKTIDSTRTAKNNSVILQHNH